MKLIIAIISFLILTNLPAQNVKHDEKLFDGYMLGAGVQLFDNYNFTAIQLPVIEARIPYTESLRLNYGGELLFGLSKFFAEWNYMGGVSYYPLGKSLGATASLKLGSALFDNISATLNAGLNFNIDISDDKYISIYAGYFHRSSRELLNYISFSKLNNGRESVNIDGRGYVISVLVGGR